MTDGSEYSGVEQAFAKNGADAVFDELAGRARADRDARLLFGARMMQARHRLGLPLVETEPVLDLPSEKRTPYEEAFRVAAREAGELCLAGGDIAGAWPYFNAIGERAPVAAAIEKVDSVENIDRIIEIAFREGVNPRKGFELILRHHGICNAISLFGANQDYASRRDCLQMLVRALYEEIAGALKRTIVETEGAAPPTDRIAELMAGRGWLFEGGNSYTDSTHLAAILRLAPELEDGELVRMAVELAEYGMALAPMFHFRGEAPFEDIYADHAVYLRALAGVDVEAAVAHFRAKATEGPAGGEVLIDLLLRVGRNAEAIAASLEFFPDAGNMAMNCPTAVQLCQIAGEWGKMRELARERGDLLSFAAGVIQG